MRSWLAAIVVLIGALGCSNTQLVEIEIDAAEIPTSAVFSSRLYREADCEDLGDATPIDVRTLSQSTENPFPAIEGGQYTLVLEARGGEDCTLIGYGCTTFEVPPPTEPIPITVGPESGGGCEEPTECLAGACIHATDASMSADGGRTACAPDAATGSNC